MPVRTTPKPLAVAVTGASGTMGNLIVPRLLASPLIGEVLALDLVPPAAGAARLTFERLDLTRPSAIDEAAGLMSRHRIQALLHLAFFSSPVRDPAYAHEVEVLGTTNLMSACVQAGVRRAVVAGTTLVYGASALNPNFLTEERPLCAKPPTRFVADKVEVDEEVRRFAADHPALRTTLLRFAPIVGPTIDNPFTRLLARPIVPLVLGFDPLVQCLHEDDAAEAALRALVAPKARGPLNVVGPGVLPLSRAVRTAGARPLPLPGPLGSATLRTLHGLGLLSVPPALLDFLRYLWIADGTRAERELGLRPRFTTREALLSFAQARPARRHHGPAPTL